MVETLLLAPLFVLVGVIVSLDVFGLTLSQGRQLNEGRPGPWAWSFWNGLWHAGLLLIYAVIIAYAFEFRVEILIPFTWILEVLASLISLLPVIELDLQPYLEVIVAQLDQHARLILGIITLIIVWNTYSEKIVSRPEEADTGQLSNLAQIIHSAFGGVAYVGAWLTRTGPGLILCRLCLKIKSTVIGRPHKSHSVQGASTGDVEAFMVTQAKAALVAIDMLALAALMNAMGFMANWPNRLTLVGIVFVVVMLLARGASWLSMNKFSVPQPGPGRKTSNPISERAKNWITISVRLFEPFMIFYFVLQLVAYLIFEEHVQSIGLFVGSGMLLYAMIASKNIEIVIKNCLSGYDGSVQRKEERPSPVGAGRWAALRGRWCTLPKALRSLIVLIVGTTAVVIYTLLWTLLYVWVLEKSLGIKDHKFSPEGAVSFALMCNGCVAAVIALVWGNKIAARFEVAKSFLAMIFQSGRTALIFILTLALIATLPVFEQLVREAWRIPTALTGEFTASDLAILGFKTNHVHAIQTALWPTLLLVMSGVYFIYRVFTRHRDESQAVTSNRFAGAMIGLSSLLLFPVTYAQEWLRIKVLPFVDFAVGTNGNLQPTLPSLAGVHLDTSAARPLTGKRVVVYATFAPLDRAYGAHAVVDMLVRAGAEVVLSFARTKEQMIADLENASVLVVPEQFGQLKPKDDAEFEEFQDVVATIKPFVQGWAQCPPCPTRHNCTHGAGRKRLVVLEGDEFCEPGRIIIGQWANIWVHQAEELNASQRLSIDPNGSPIMKQIKHATGRGGMSFEVFGGSIEADLYFVPESENGRIARPRVVVGHNKKAVIIGFDFHNYAEWQEHMFVNACSAPLE